MASRAVSRKAALPYPPPWRVASMANSVEEQTSTEALVD
jgi:hypothetical protein